MIRNMNEEEIFLLNENIDKRINFMENSIEEAIKSREEISLKAAVSGVQIAIDTYNIEKWNNVLQYLSNINNESNGILYSNSNILKLWFGVNLLNYLTLESNDKLFDIFIANNLEQAKTYTSNLNELKGFDYGIIVREIDENWQTIYDKEKYRYLDISNSDIPSFVFKIFVLSKSSN